MKALFALLIVSTSLSAFACNPEALFIGTVTNLKATPEGFTYQVKLNYNSSRYYFQPSGVCPLFEHELEAAVLSVDKNSTLKDGDMISGVMVQNGNTGLFHIE